jgi:hypothetical protein
MTHPALSVSPTVYKAFEAAHFGEQIRWADWDNETDEEGSRALRIAIAAAIAQWVRETIAAKSDYEVERLATMMEFLEGHGDARLHLLTFMGVNPT